MNGDPRKDLGPRRSLRLKLVGPIAVLGSCLALVLGVLLAGASKEMASRGIEKHARSVAHAVVCTTECTSNVEDLRRIVNALAAEQGVESIVVVGGRPLCVIAGNRNVLVGKPPSELSPDLRHAVTRSIESKLEESMRSADESSIVYAIPVRTTFKEIGRADGVVVVRVDTAEVTSSIHALTARVGIWLFVAISMLVVVSVGLIGKFVIAPLRVVESAASSTDRTQSTARLPNDEIGDLGRRLESAQTASARATRTLDVLNHALDLSAIIAMTDVRGNITYANDRFVDISGWSREDLLGVNHRILNSGFHPREFFSEMFAVIAKGGIWRGEICNKKKSGGHYWVDTTIVPNIDDDGRLLGYTSIRFDITASKAIERALVVAKEAADDASRAKSGFLATMSHELRTPLNGILGFSDLLVDAQLGKEEHESVEIIRNSANALLIILNDILDFSKIEAGKMTVESSHFDGRCATMEVVRLLSAQASEKGVVVTWDWPSDTPVCVVGDPLRLRQVLLNLVGNAIKFTEKGSVSIRARAVENRIRFEIVDTGIGIADETLQRLFAKFTQADSSTTRRFGGTGLGLAISKNLVELMGGRIGADSRLGHGSTFWFELPVGRSDAMTGKEEERASRDAELRFDGCRVLLAEDNAVNRKLAVRVLETLGCVVDTANDGAVAVEMVKRHDYDVVLMDCLMPEMDGFSASCAIRDIEKDTGKSAIPIIALTANAQAADREACRTAGMDDFLSKPFRRSELVSALARNLR